jgi:HSP20 family protein
MNRLFGRLWEDWPVVTGSDGWMPSVDVYEKDGNLVVEAELPGMKKEDVHVAVTQDSVTIEGKRTEEKKEERKGYYYRERRAGQYYRKISLPAKVDEEKVKAAFKDGILTITLPQREEIPQGKHIAIEG